MKARRIALTVGPGFGVVVAWVALVVLPSASSADEVGIRLRDSDQEIALLTSQLGTSSQLASQAEVLQAELAELDRSVPSAVDVAGFVRMVHGMATASGVVVEQVAPRSVEDVAAQPEPLSPENGPAAVETRLDLSVRGSYPQAVAFPESLVGGERLVLIESVLLQGSAGAQQELAVTLTVRIFSHSGQANPVESVESVESVDPAYEAGAVLTLEPAE